MEVHLTNLQRDRFYVCSTVERAEQFGRSPGVYLDGVKKIVRQTPCLHALLRVRDEDSPPSTVGVFYYFSQSSPSIWLNKILCLL